LDHSWPRLCARVGRYQTFRFFVVVKGFTLTTRKTY
jgi:hypothetical protein